MNQLDTIPSTLTSAPASLTKLEPARRLIVLIPDLEADYLPAIRRIHELANAQSAHVLLLSLCKDARQKHSLRRRLITLSAMLRDERLLVDINIEVGTNWVEVVSQISQQGDTVVCFAEQRAGILQRPLSQILQSNLKSPVYILSSVNTEATESNRLWQVMSWAVGIAIIAGFYFLQMNIVQLSKDWAKNFLLILSILPEFWLIWRWNS